MAVSISKTGIRWLLRLVKFECKSSEKLMQRLEPEHGVVHTQHLEHMVLLTRKLEKVLTADIKSITVKAG